MERKNPKRGTFSESEYAVVTTVLGSFLKIKNEYVDQVVEVGDSKVYEKCLEALRAAISASIVANVPVFPDEPISTRKNPRPRVGHESIWRLLQNVR